MSREPRKPTPRSGAPSDAIPRRDFLKVAAAFGLLGDPDRFGRDSGPDARPGPGLFARPSPRLTARPYPPRLDPERGMSTVGDQLDRGGLLYVPRSYDRAEPAPLMVALHGSGGSASSWSRLFDLCEAVGVVLVAPDSRGRTWDRVNGIFGPDVAFIDAALRYAFDRCAVDEGHLALAGFSDGASYALSLGPSNGDLFTHLIAWSPGFSAPEDPIVGTPRVFVSHGTEDRVLPLAGSRGGIVPMFEMDGYSVTYEEFEGGHEMPPFVLEETFDWFLRPG